MDEVEAARQTDAAALAMKFVELAIEHNPQMDTLFEALASVVVGFSLQYVHSGPEELTHENVTQQLAKFYAFSVDLAQLKLQAVKEGLIQEAK